MDVKFTDTSKEVLEELERKIKRGLNAMGMAAETHAKENLQRNPKRVDTGRLRNSITHTVLGHDAYIGTNVEYAPYVEYGTGPYAEGGGRNDVPWYYKDENGETHSSYGMPGNHFLKDAASDHTKEYKDILESSLKN